MNTLLISHPDCLGHVTPPGHPERVARLEAINAVLEHESFAYLDRREADLVSDAALLRCHPQRYLDRIEAAIPSGEGWQPLDADTLVMRGSLAAARRAAGAAVQAVDAVLSGEVTNAFCAVRPPGHHAEAETAMGFCLFGSVAIAAKHALDHHGLSRVAVIDFDVHHGNGTQALLWDEPRATFVSTHQMPLFPGTGAADERGAHGQIFNLPFEAGTDGPAYRAAFESLVLPQIAAAAPDLILVSAGFDAHRADPLAQMALESDDFAWVTERICDLAADHCEGRVVSCLEGGYDLRALAESVAVHVGVLMRCGA